MAAFVASAADVEETGRALLDEEPIDDEGGG